VAIGNIRKTIEKGFEWLISDMPGEE